MVGFGVGSSQEKDSRRIVTALTLRNVAAFRMEVEQEPGTVPRLCQGLGHLLRPPGLRSAPPEGAGCGPRSPRASRGSSLWGQRSREDWAAGELCFQPWSLGHRLTRPTPLDSRHVFLKAAGKASSFKTLIKKLFSLRHLPRAQQVRAGRCLFSLTKEMAVSRSIPCNLLTPQKINEH